METEAEAQLAEARAELIRDRATFERQVSSVFDRLTTERLQLAEQQRRLLADRKHLVLIGRRLRRRWQGQRKSAGRLLKEREAWVDSETKRLELETDKSQKERAELQSLRDRLVTHEAEAAKQHQQHEADIATLLNQRTALVDFRICVEADCRRAEERRTRLQAEVRDLENRIHELRKLCIEIEGQGDRAKVSSQFPDRPSQKVA
jgi:chromosome segregation ATPase